MRPKAEWAIDSEPIRARGVIVKYQANRFFFNPVKVQETAMHRLESFFSHELPFWTKLFREISVLCTEKQPTDLEILAYLINPSDCSTSQNPLISRR